MRSFTREGATAISCEFKYDGQRAQIHLMKADSSTAPPSDGQRKIDGSDDAGGGDGLTFKVFSRHLEDVTVRFADIMDHIRWANGDRMCLYPVHPSMWRVCCAGRRCCQVPWSRVCWTLSSVRSTPPRRTGCCPSRHSPADPANRSTGAFPSVSSSSVSERAREPGRTGQANHTR